MSIGLLLFVFRAYGINVRLNHTNLDPKDAEWSDLIITAGGDGTFLKAAGMITNTNKAIVGVNSQPLR